MKIAVCDRCKKKDIEGLLCSHCDTSFCYECLDIHPADIHICPDCEKFICKECHEGMVECDIKVD